MAVILYRGDETVRIEPTSLQQHLQAGWQLEPGLPVEEAESEADEAPQNGDASSAEIREAAQAAGIEGWDTKRIKTLRRELGYEED